MFNNFMYFFDPIFYLFFKGEGHSGRVAMFLDPHPVQRMVLPISGTANCGPRRLARNVESMVALWEQRLHQQKTETPCSIN